MLPPGVHPHDRRSAPNAPGGTSPTPAAQPTVDGARGRPPFAVPNGRAMGVFQRGSKTWSGRPFSVGDTPSRIVGRQRGRSSILLWVPKKLIISGALVALTATAGICIAPSMGEATQYAGFILLRGDSIELPTEASLYGIALPTTARGYCQWSSFYNPSGDGATGT